MRRFLLLLLIVVFCTCRKGHDTAGSEIFFQVEFTGSYTCALPEIIFLTNRDEAYKIIGDSKGIYLAYGLPKVIYQQGDKLWVRIRKPETNELTACITSEPSWSWVTITETK